MLFEEFAGNDNIKKILFAYLDEGRIPHVMLLEGTDGIGKRTLARMIAQAALCQSEQGKPCGQCPSCVKAEGGNHPDIFEADNQDALYKIDYVRDIRQSAYVKPNESSRRIIILPNLQQMRADSQSVILKILEEPPEYLLFILTCENRMQLLPTVLSRSVCLSLEPVEQSLAAQALKKILPDTSEQDALNAAAIFGGVIGQAVKGISEGSYRHLVEFAPEIAAAVIAPEELALLRLTAKVEKDADGLLNSLTLIFRDALVLKAGAAGDISPNTQTAQMLAHKLSSKQLFEILDNIEKLKQAKKRYINHMLFITLLCSRLRTAAGR